MSQRERHAVHAIGNHDVIHRGPLYGKAIGVPIGGMKDHVFGLGCDPRLVQERFEPDSLPFCSADGFSRYTVADAFQGDNVRDGWLGQQLRIGEGERGLYRSSNGQGPLFSRYKGWSSVRCDIKFFVCGDGTDGSFWRTDQLAPHAGLCRSDRQEQGSDGQGPRHSKEPAARY